MRSIKYECLNHFIIFGEAHVRYVINEYTAHYHSERNDQGLGNDLIDKSGLSANDDGPVVSTKRLGGLLSIIAEPHDVAFFVWVN